MPKNLAASKRYVIIDECLSNDFHIPSTSSNPHYRGIWPVCDIAEKIRSKLDLVYAPCERTIKEDIRIMRSGDLGYYAPIENERGVGYYYADPDFSITKNPLSEIDIENLKEILAILKQFKGFKYFSDVHSIISKIEDTVNVSEFNRILLHTVHGAVGLEFIEPLKRAIGKCNMITVSYQPFNRKKPLQLELHPYVLKEYNNRWFFLAYSLKDKNTWVYAVDRIKQIVNTDVYFEEPDPVEISKYFSDIIGVSRPGHKKPEMVLLKISKPRDNYIITKPIHYSQEFFPDDENHTIFKYKLIPNNELIALILSFGGDIEVIKPISLRKTIIEIIKSLQKNYVAG